MVTAVWNSIEWGRIELVRRLPGIVTLIMKSGGNETEILNLHLNFKVLYLPMVLCQHRKVTDLVPVQALTSL